MLQVPMSVSGRSVTGKREVKLILYSPLGRIQIPEGAVRHELNINPR